MNITGSSVRKRLSVNPEKIKKEFKTKEEFIEAYSKRFDWLETAKLSDAWDLMFPAKESKKQAEAKKASK